MFQTAFLPVLWACIFSGQRDASHTWQEVYKWTLRVRPQDICCIHISLLNFQLKSRYCLTAPLGDSSQGNIHLALHLQVILPVLCQAYLPPTPQP